MTDTDLFARLEFMTWRDEQLEAISIQLENDFPNLQHQIDTKIDEASTFDLAWSEVQLGTEIAQLCSEWAREHTIKALERTEAALAEFKARLEPEFSLDPGLGERLFSVAPALASAGLAAASIAAVPTVISFATVSTSALAIFGVSYVSWPLFTVGAVALGTAALASRSLFDWAIKNWRDKLRIRAHKRAEEVVFGIGVPAGQRTILNDIQALAVQAAANSMRQQT